MVTPTVGKDKAVARRKLTATSTMRRSDYPDGRLLGVSRSLTRRVRMSDIATTLSAELEIWGDAVLFLCAASGRWDRSQQTNS